MSKKIGKISIFIADDHQVVREGIRSILTQKRRFVVIGEAENGEEALSGVLELKPDLVVLDISMPKINGITVTKRVLEALPDTKVLILSMHAEVQSAIEAFRAGALGYVLKDSAHGELIDAVLRVVDGRKYASPSIADGLLDGFVEAIKREDGDDPCDRLSARELEVFKMIADGDTSKEVAEKLFVSVSTVKTHRIHIMKKLGVSDMAGLIKIAIRKGLTSPM
ncbi:MAG: response regulator transcription factor [Proteobacteria bacterium]|nr:response regulator transcription factor [Pseudomonadota bacterium]